MTRNDELDIRKRRLQMIDALETDSREVFHHEDGRRSTLRGNDVERLRLRAFIVNNRAILTGQHAANNMEI